MVCGGIGYAPEVGETIEDEITEAYWQLQQDVSRDPEDPPRLNQAETELPARALSLPSRETTRNRRTTRFIFVFE